MKTRFVKISIFAGELNNAITDAEERFNCKYMSKTLRWSTERQGWERGRRSQESRGGREV